jgi:hypothetical protein
LVKIENKSYAYLTSFGLSPPNQKSAYLSVRKNYMTFFQSISYAIEFVAPALSSKAYLKNALIKDI